MTIPTRSDADKTLDERFAALLDKLDEYNLYDEVRSEPDNQSDNSP